METPTPPSEAIPNSTELALVDQAIDTYARDPEAPAPSWRIDGLNTAEWAMRKLAHARQLIDDLRAQHDAWVEPIDAWLVDAVRPLQRTVDFFTGQLERYALDQRVESGNATKSVSLPSGKVSTRSSATTVKITDSDGLLTELDHLGISALPDVVKREVRISELMKLCVVVDSVVMHRESGVVITNLEVQEPKLSAHVAPR